MSRTDEKLQEFETLWDTLALDRTVELVDGRTATMRPAATLFDGGDSRNLSRLPRLTGSDDGETLPEVEMRGLIGRGGMGEVSLARQVPLARDVAVKSVRPEARNAEATLVLLRESWVTGRLEHPNIVPVYTLGRGESGEPMIVMKKIEGVSWAEMLRDPSTAPRAFDSDDPLDWHLEIFTQVCNAVHYAHSKGIIHRDIKPENVMLGEFGEVYLLDWGIAVSLEADPDKRLPDVSDVTSPAGTPAYMAPEMVTGEGDELCVQTDVFLLGAVLHEILVGEPPNKGDTLFQIMFDAYNPQPRDYPAAVHPELAAICHRAMHAEPAERYESAEAFRQALARHMGHRDSLRISQKADSRLTALREVLEREAAGEDAPPEQQIYKVFGECRFGFEQAIEVSPDNVQARRGLQRSLELMAERELDRQAYQAASLLVADLPEPNPELERRLEEVSARLESRDQELEDLKRIRYEENVDVSRRSRGLLAIMLGLLWASLSLAIPHAIELLGIVVTPELYLAHYGLIFAAVLVPLYLGRRALLKNAANRKIIASFVCLTVGGALARGLGLILDLPVSTTLTFETLLYAAGGAVVSTALDRRIAPAALAFGIATVLMAVFPAQMYVIFGLAALIGMTALALAWWKGL